MIDACEAINHMDNLLLTDSSKWTKHTRWEWDDNFQGGRMCLLGALSMSVAGSPHDIPASDSDEGIVYNQVATAICKAANLDDSAPSMVIEFNDAPITEFDDVKRVLSKAREILCG